MAKAPTPGSVRRNEAANTAMTIITITVRGETYKVAPLNLPLREDLLLANLGFTAEGLLAQMGLRSIKILWWLARRVQGESALTLEQAWDEWPEDIDIESELDVDVAEPDEKAKDPEA